MNIKHEQSYVLNELKFYDRTQTPLIVHAVAVTLIKQAEVLTELQIRFHINHRVYKQIEQEAFFNLKPELRGSPSAGNFQPEPAVETAVTLQPDLLTHLADHAANPEQTATYLQTLTHKQPDHPLLFTEHWYALQVNQRQPSGETGYRTFWSYVSLSSLLAEGSSSEQLSEGLLAFFLDWAKTNLPETQQDVIATTFKEKTSEFAVEADSSPVSTLIQRMLADAFEKTLNAFDLNSEVAPFTMPSSSPIKGQIFEKMLHFFSQDDWAFATTPGETTLRLAFQGKSAQWTCYAQAREQQQQFVFYSICPLKVPETKNLAIAEFIARANFGMIIGNFELDFTDGEIRYKTSINVEGANLTFPQIKRLVYANVTMMDQYLPGIMSVLDGDVEPKDAIAQIEGLSYTTEQ